MMKTDENIRKEALEKALKEMGVTINEESLNLDTLFKINRDTNDISPLQQILFNEFLEKENINKA